VTLPLADLWRQQSRQCSKDIHQSPAFLPSAAPCPLLFAFPLVPPFLPASWSFLLAPKAARSTFSKKKLLLGLLFPCGRDKESLVGAVRRAKERGPKAERLRLPIFLGDALGSSLRRRCCTLGASFAQGVVPRDSTTIQIFERHKTAKFFDVGLQRLQPLWKTAAKTPCSKTREAREGNLLR